MSSRGPNGLPPHVEAELAEQMLRDPHGADRQSWLFPIMITRQRVPNSPNPDLHGFMVAFPARGAPFHKVVMPAVYRLMQSMGMTRKDLATIDGHLYDDWVNFNSPRKFVLEGKDFVEVTKPSQYTTIANRRKSK